MRTPTTRSVLAKRAASLPVGAPERKAILTFLKSGMTLKGGPPPGETVLLTIGQDRGGKTMFKGKVKASALQKYNDLVDEIYAAMGGDNPGGYNDKVSRLADAMEAVKEAQRTVDFLEKEMAPLLTKAKALKIDPSDFKGADMYHIDFTIVDESGQKWYIDGGEDWTKE